ncbi:MAG: DUF4367 domain-containing protein [Bacillota bacterium]
MVRKKRIKKYIKQHPEIFDVDENRVSHHISEDKIPDISWFYERNPDVIKAKEPSAQPRKPWYLSMKLLIPVSAVLLIAVFLAATPVGRVVADAIYKTVEQCFNNEVNVKHGQGDIQSEKEDETKSTYNSIEEARLNYSGKIAYSEIETLEKIEIEKTDFSTVISSTYTTPQNLTFYITQTVYKGETEWSSSIASSDGQPIKHTLKNGIEANGYINEKTAYAIAYMNNVSIQLTTNDVNYEEFMRFIKSIEIE